MRFPKSMMGVALLATSLVGCGSKGDGDGDDTGGSSTTAGSASGGSSGSGATSNTEAGASSEGGTGATAGSATGGTSSGGTSSGEPIPEMPVYTFDTTVEGFIFQDSSGATTPVVVTPVPPAEIMITHNADDGEPDPGSIQVDIPFSEASQYVSIGVPIDQATPLDLTNRTVSAYVKVVSGWGDPVELMTAPANAKLFIKTGLTYVYASADVANITMVGEWTKITFDPALPFYVADKATYDPTQVFQIGIQFDTNSASTTAAPAVVLVDTISY